MLTKLWLLLLFFNPAENHITAGASRFALELNTPSCRFELFNGVLCVPLPPQVISYFYRNDKLTHS